MLTVTDSAGHMDSTATRVIHGERCGDRQRPVLGRHCRHRLSDASDRHAGGAHGHRGIFSGQRRRECRLDAHHYLQQHQWLRT